jgi:hypothetical protein
MWVTIAISAFILMLILLVWQRWKVSSEWIRMERDLSEDEYAIWKRKKQRDAEEWSNRWKWAESGFILILAVIMFGFWLLIP